MKHSPARRRHSVVLVIGIMVLFLPAIAPAIASQIIADDPVLIENREQPADPNAFKPTQCDALTVTAVFANGDSGGPGKDLVIGTTGADIISGNGDDDCVRGNGGVDILSGGDGNDICIGTAAATFDASCETTFLE